MFKLHVRRKIGLMVLLFIVTAQAYAEFRKHIIIPKVGYYKLRNQYTGSFNFDTTSENVYGFEYERRFTTGFSIGAEHVHFTNDFSHINTGNTDTFKTDIIFFKAKYYFNIKNSLKPFLGLGAGYGSAKTYDYGSAIDGEAYQYCFGLAYEFSRVGMYFEYKGIYTKLDREWMPYSLYPATEEIDVSGKGLFAGVSIKF